jgi:NifU-like protein involved in Fe-S cluster formation
MAAALYTQTILRLAASVPHDGRLDAPDGTAERRSAVCGSRVTVDVVLDAEGRIAAIGQEVRACALGQASASLMGAHALGRSADELDAARDAIAGFLARERTDPGAWPGLDVFLAAQDYPARHPSIRLAFEAVAEATAKALEARRARPA